LCHLQGWSRQGNKLHRQYHFSSFEKALGFLSGLALVAQAAGHALEESEVYDSVTVDLTTPELGGIADVDVELATQADALADSLNLPRHLDSTQVRRKGHEKTDNERTP
jgi:4a-hydroxytetrahydrobiopterin dehydratase